MERPVSGKEVQVEKAEGVGGGFMHEKSVAFKKLVRFATR
jgi:hypothetical protein